MSSTILKKQYEFNQLKKNDINPPKNPIHRKNPWEKPIFALVLKTPLRNRKPHIPHDGSELKFHGIRGANVKFDDTVLLHVQTVSNETRYTYRGN